MKVLTFLLDKKFFFFFLGTKLRTVLISRQELCYWTFITHSDSWRLVYLRVIIEVYYKKFEETIFVLIMDSRTLTSNTSIFCLSV